MLNALRFLTSFSIYVVTVHNNICLKVDDLDARLFSGGVRAEKEHFCPICLSLSVTLDSSKSAFDLSVTKTTGTFFSIIAAAR